MSDSSEFLVRINGILPAQIAAGIESERAREVVSKKFNANTSCSVIARRQSKSFHLLVDVGKGVIESMKSEPGFSDADAVLLTHAHDDHVEDLPLLAQRSNSIKIFCTSECKDQVARKFPSLQLNIETISHGESKEIGPFTVTAFAANHGAEESIAGAVIYIIRYGQAKIVTAWDFLTVSDLNNNLFWNSDLLIVGAESYNEHPSTGMISVTEAYEYVKRWNPRETYIVHYSGLMDFEDAKNQWFRGPVKAMTTEELQRTIDSYRQLAGMQKLPITVATQGMVWRYSENVAQEEIGNEIEVTSLEKYLFKLAKDDGNTLLLTVEDNINRFELDFVNPKSTLEGEQIRAEGVKGMMAKGPDLELTVVPQTKEEAIAKFSITKGKKGIFVKDVRITAIDASRLMKFNSANFNSA